MHFIEHYLVAAVLFVVIDAGWLTFIKKTYEKLIGDWLLKKPDILAAAIFYALYILGLIIFVIDPALSRKSLTYAIGHGALLGLVMYSTYEFTNKATLKKWTYKLLLPDLAWGTFITAAVSSITYLIFK
jgi:uncharacterized membrane protein